METIGEAKERIYHDERKRTHSYHRSRRQRLDLRRRDAKGGHRRNLCFYEGARVKSQASHKKISPHNPIFGLLAFLSRELMRELDRTAVALLPNLRTR